MAKTLNNVRYKVQGGRARAMPAVWNRANCPFGIQDTAVTNTSLIRTLTVGSGIWPDQPL